MKRSQKQQILKDINKKMVFITGPRQVGKTWLAKHIGKEFQKTTYLNYDRLEDRKIIASEGWLQSTELIILDEIHKMKGWKNFLKGVFDTRPEHQKIIVTGSARLDIFRKTGDSMAGRYFIHRLMPFSPAELKGTEYEKGIDRFLERGGFPEPFLAEDKTDADRWRLQYTDDIIRSDVFDYERINDYKAMKLVLELLRTKVGSPVSYQSISEDVQVAPNTVRKYIDILEALYIVFRVTPYARNIGRSLLKSPKIYFYDSGMVKGDSGAVLENFAAVCLYKHVIGKEDCEGVNHNLHYIRTKEGREIDFCLVKEQEAELLIECKYSDGKPSRDLLTYCEKLGKPGVQLVKDLKREQKVGRIEVRSAENFLPEL